VAQAARLSWTVGITAENLVGAQCRAVVGLGNAKDAKWLSGQHMVGVWFKTLEDAGAHQVAMHCVADGKYQALAVAPLANGRLDPPDIGCHSRGDDVFHQWAFSGRATSDSIGAWSANRRARTPGSGRSRRVSPVCFAERRYGGVLDDEMLMALPPDQLTQAITGMEALAKNGFRYPFPQYGIQQDVRAGMAVSYPDRKP
jgi:uncharacterized protein (DUF169 family)